MQVRHQALSIRFNEARCPTPICRVTIDAPSQRLADPPPDNTPSPPPANQAPLSQSACAKPPAAANSGAHVEILNVIASVLLVHPLGSAASL